MKRFNSKSFQILLFLIYLITINSCTHLVVINVTPHDAEIRINDEEYNNIKEYRTTEKNLSISINKEGYIPVNTKLESIIKKNNIYNFELEKYKYPVNITMLSRDKKAHLLLKYKGADITGHTIKTELEYGNYDLLLVSGKKQLTIPITVDQPFSLQIRNPEIVNNIENISLIPSGIFKCGSQPKQVNISPDNKFIFIPLLNGTGFQIFDIRECRIIKTITPGSECSKKGFVEGCFVPELKAYFISQMTTGKIYEYDVSDYRNPKLKRTINTEGKWSKVVTYSRKLNIIAVSNWLSNNISLIDYKNGKLIRQISDISVPRGITFSAKGDFLYAASFNDGSITKYRTKNWKKISELKIRDSAMRHIVITNDDSTLFVSAMGLGKVYKISTDTFKITKTYSGFINPNTISLTPDDNYLIISSRGKNNPDGYLNKSNEPGFITILDLYDNKRCILNGGLQPTGLDISNDSRFFIFSNFQDNTIEFYRMETVNN